MLSHSQRRSFGRLLKVSSLVCLAGILMGVEGCQQQETRNLRRRVQMGKIQAPTMMLPGGRGPFDFQFVANAQMYDILRKTGSFSTATIDPNKTYDPSGLSNDEAASFNQCTDPLEPKGAGLHAKSTISEYGACMIDLPQGVVSGAILNFQLTSSAGTSVSLLDIPLLPSLSFDFKSYELSMALNVMDPLIVGQNIAATSKQSFANNLTVAATVNFGGFQLGPKLYYDSPLRQVVDNGMTMAVTDLKSQWDRALPWYAMVLRNCDKSIYINAGNKTDAGLMVNDLVRIHNVRYRWAGEVCASHLMGTDMNENPVAWARIVSVGDTISVAKIVENDPKYPYSPDQLLKPGSRVYMEKMAPATTAKAAVRK